MTAAAASLTPDVALSDADRALLERRRRLLGPSYRLFYEEPVHLVRGEGVWLYDADGRRYLDAYNNVASVGHCHPVVVDAIARQSATLNTHTRYLHEGILDFAEDLLGEFPGELGNVVLTCTGSEANDLALRVARAHTQGTGVIVTSYAYHGVTAALAELSPSLGPAIQPGPHVRYVAAPDPYRDPNAATRFADDVQHALDDLRAHGIRPAAMLVDSILSSDGIVASPPGFLAAAAQRVRAAGALFIADEVQPGFGRTGATMWGFERHGFVPDLVTLGKPMGNGHPVAAVVARPEVMLAFGTQMRYFNTFGGNPVSCAAAAAVLNVIRDERLRDNAASTGALLGDALRDLAKRYEGMGDVRGAGLFVGVELVTDRATRAPDAGLASRVVNGMRRRGVLISASGPHANVLKIRPPLVFRSEHVSMLVATLDEVLRETA
ncbi:aspartate aminotransferase family protein [Paraburkholderia acidisoli]|uniref:Aminotransferase class III-fold pyridoxal phosphate-dependent enzyme n=1 Tax=Paraburkholderia acidisoli TaxID=2571748 RepID=A0A7Z2GM02_9BURK|nr:aminotransferase class III-fold pyridoxal phosphate-dependent enzyme [Paraburkholderia acidisoli]QGZ64277.1 aminotransferase class III-fold pyridoxal phosphate-dependent enzyme [Paraburkholderia acidisoli]